MTQQAEQTSQAQAAPAPDADALGALIGSYDKGFPHAFGIWFAAALSFAFGLFILWLCAQNRHVMAPRDAVTILYAVGVTAVSLGAALGLLIRRLVAAQPAYDVFEHGIRTRNRDGEQTALYRDIEDMFSYNNRAMAFRISPRTPWVFLGYYPDQFAVLTQLHVGHMAERGLALLLQVMDGKTAVFRYFRHPSWLTRNMLMNTRTSELTLNKQRLTIGDKSIDIDRIDDMHISPWTGKKTIMAKDGTVFHTMPINAVLSFEVLHLVLSSLQRLQSPQPGP